MIDLRAKVCAPKSTPSVREYKVGAGAELAEYKGGGAFGGRMHEMAANI